MSVNNYDKTIGVVVTPPTAATQGDQPVSTVTTAAPPGIQVGPTRVEIQGHFKYLGSITQGNGGQDRAIQSRINTASQVFRSLKKYASCTGQQSHGPSRPTGDLPQLLHAPHDGPVPGHRGPLHS